MCFRIEWDELCGMYFVYHAGKRLYFSKTIRDKKEAEDYYRGVLLEQDRESPHKYTDEGKYTTLDSMIEEPVNFIKMDIEGNEWDALQGAEKLIQRSENLKCAVCAYHGDFDELLIKNILEKYGMGVSTTQGYMWYPDTNRQTYISTRLCRGIVRGIKG